MYEMKEEYLTGNEVIDAEHTRLFELIDEIYNLAKDEFRSDKYDQIMNALNELSDYTDYHFKHEEEYMESIDYDDIFIQKAQHKIFIKKLNSVDLKEIDDGDQDKFISELLEFLTDWLVNHIVKLDKLIPVK